VHTTSTPRAAALDTTALAHERVAALEPSAPAALQGFAGALSHALTGALSQASPLIPSMATHEVVNQLNEHGLAIEYSDLVAGFARGGILDRHRLRRIGEELGIPYVLQPGLAEFMQVVGDKFEAVASSCSRLACRRTWI
jgi:hypothetical protein